MLDLLNRLNDKYDFWSFFSDFIFVFGVLVLGWSPVLLFLLFIIDTSVMVIFVNILFHKENYDWVKTIAFFFTTLMFLSIMTLLYHTLGSFIESLELDDVINSDPSQIINSYILPIILVSSGLNHYTEFDKSIQKMKNGTYKSTFIKHFFLRYFSVTAIIVIIVLGQHFLNSALFVGLIGIKALLRMWNKKYRDIF